MNLKKKRVIQQYNMSIPMRYALSVIVLLLVVLLGGHWFAQKGALGGVSVGGEYFATTSDSTSADTHSQIKFSGSTCTVGSIIVASTSATTLTLWNATSTTDTASTTIVQLKASVVEGTYTFDALCSRGLVIETPSGFNGYYVITWR